jgi:hypothetical protein
MIFDEGGSAVSSHPPGLEGEYGVAVHVAESEKPIRIFCRGYCDESINRNG